MKTIGILGFAHGHVKSYCNRWGAEPERQIKVAAGWDHDAERLQEAVDAFKLTPAGSPDELVARDDIDAVVIGAETARHADLVETAAKAGKTIVLQKPMALTLPQADRIVDAVESNQVPFTMAWQMREDPQNQKIRELLEDGAVGKLMMVRRRHGLSAQMWPWIFDSWHIAADENRDLWADDAAHAVDFIHWLLGLPTTVTAELSTRFDERMPNDNGIAIYRYDDGLIAEVSCSFNCLGAENTVEIFGDEGAIVQNYGDAPSCNLEHGEQPGLKWLKKGETTWTCFDVPSPDNHGKRIAALADPLGEFIHGKRGPIATATEGRDSLRMVLATYVSNRDGRRVSIFDSNVADV